MARTALVVLAIIGLFVCTHIPNEFSEAALKKIGIEDDKTAHTIAYGCLMVIIALAFWRRLGALYAVLAAALVVAVIGGLDEITQDFVGRVSSVRDWAADMLGAAYGAGGFLILATLGWIVNRSGSDRISRGVM